MIRHSFALLLLLASLAACARDNAPANPAATGSSGSGTTAVAAPATGAGTSSGAGTVGDLAAAAATQQEGSDLAAPKDDSGETQLERIAALPPEGQLPAVKWSAGTQYRVISPAQPTNVAPDRVEVIEFFWYGCPHCFALEPAVEGWLKNKANYVEFVRVPATWGEPHRAHARLFLTLKALGKVDELQNKVFNEIHVEHHPLYAAGDPLQTQREQLQFAKDNGIAESDFTKAYNAFSVQTGLSAADDLNRRYRIDAVPTFVIAGKYATDLQAAGGESNLFQIINDLAASEKHH